MCVCVVTCSSALRGGSSKTRQAHGTLTECLRTRKQDGWLQVQGLVRGNQLNVQDIKETLLKIIINEFPLSISQIKEFSRDGYEGRSQLK